MLQNFMARIHWMFVGIQRGSMKDFEGLFQFFKWKLNDYMVEMIEVPKKQMISFGKQNGSEKVKRWINGYSGCIPKGSIEVSPNSLKILNWFFF